MLDVYFYHYVISSKKNNCYVSQVGDGYRLIDSEDAQNESTDVTWGEIFADYNRFPFVHRSVTFFRHHPYFSLFSEINGSESIFFEFDGAEFYFSIEYISAASIGEGFSLSKMLESFPVNKVEQYLKERKLI